MLFTEDGNIAGNTLQLEAVLIAETKEALLNQQSSFKNYISEKQRLTEFIEMVRPAASLVIIGAGNDVLPLVKMADTLGWQTTVANGRPDYAKADALLKPVTVR